MKLTDPEIIEARKTALENNPRSYEAWYEVLTFGREIERLVQTKYWRDFAKEKPHEEGWYAVIVDNRPQSGIVHATTLHWSRMYNAFVKEPGAVDPIPNITFFKPMSEITQELEPQPT